VNVTHQKTENIKAAAMARISVINAKATSNATKILNKGAGLVQQQNINYTSKAYMEIQNNLKFTNLQKSLLEYYYYKRIDSLGENTINRLFVGNFNATVLE